MLGLEALLAAVSDPAADSTALLGPLVHAAWAKILVVAAAYAVTLALSGVLVRALVLSHKDDAYEQPSAAELRAATVIGKCENFLTITFVLAGQETGLALIIAAKTLVRRDDIQKDSGFFLGGTLVNLCFGLLVAIVARALVSGI